MALCKNFNSNITASRTLALGNDLYWTQKDIPNYNQFIVEYHGGLGLDIPLKRVSIRFEAFLNYAFTNRYTTEGTSLGVFYKFKK